MLEITILGSESFNDETQEFVYPDSQTVRLEHSLVSLSLWESKWEKPFLTNDSRSEEEIKDYVRCMLEAANFPGELIHQMSNDNFSEVNAYLGKKHTATWFSEVGPKASSHKIITAEVIYGWMVTMQIPFECQNWPLKRLITLIRVVQELTNPKKKRVSMNDRLAQQREINAQRRAMYGTTG